jgi:tRNA threonylcarbamoyl adenosine modification protein YeaZ
MRVLAFDTTGPILSVGAASDGKPLCRRDRMSVRGKGNLLDVLIEETLQCVNWSRPDVEGIALLTGPGSLTAIRIGWATAAGWAQAMRIPLVGWTVAAAHRRAWGEEARDVACCVHFRADTFLLYDLGMLESRPVIVKLEASADAHDPPRILTGPGLIGNRGRWEAYYNNATRIIDDADATIGADTLALWGEQDLLAGQGLEIHSSPLEYGLPPDFKKLANA